MPTSSPLSNLFNLAPASQSARPKLPNASDTSGTVAQRNATFKQSFQEINREKTSTEHRSDRPNHASAEEPDKASHLQSNQYEQSQTEPHQVAKTPIKNDDKLGERESVSESEVTKDEHYLVESAPEQAEHVAKTAEQPQTDWSELGEGAAITTVSETAILGHGGDGMSEDFAGNALPWYLRTGTFKVPEGQVEPAPSVNLADNMSNDAKIVDLEQPAIEGAESLVLIAPQRPGTSSVRAMSNSLNDASLFTSLNGSPLDGKVVDGKLLPPSLPDATLTLQLSTTHNKMTSDVDLSAGLELGGKLKEGFALLLRASAPTVDSIITSASQSSAAAPLLATDSSNVFSAQLASPLLAGQSPALQLEGRVALPMSVAFGHTQWTQQLAERTAWMAGQSIQSAEIQLDPPELGPLQIKIHMHQDQASVNFVSANPQVREAVEQSLARLRDMLQEQGMELVDSGVADQHSEQRNSGNDTGEILNSKSDADNESSEGAETLPHVVYTAAPWTIDFYA